MIAQLSIATVMVCLTVGIHGIGLYLLARVLRLERQAEKEMHFSAFSQRGIFTTFAVVLGLFSLHGIEIWLYAFLYLLLGAIPDLETAVYFSTITFGTIGYDDEAMSHSWQLVSAIEGINGILLLGWSTAFFISLISRFWKL